MKNNLKLTTVFLRITVGVGAAFALVACSTTNSDHPNSGRYKQAYDSAPPRLPTASELRDPQPRQEEPSRQGNRTYQLFGKTYNIMGNAENYQAEGTASWYGTKFHGHLTSNGEFYDMYSMSAAHKTLPLPTYLRVTNLANDKSVVVRVNDRGPFHGDRLIDLSYSAAYKIGMLDTGTAKVRVEAVSAPVMLSENNTETAAEHPTTPATVDIPAQAIEPEAAEPHFFVQVMAASDAGRLQQEADVLSKLLQVPATTQQKDGLHRLVLGPLPSADASELLEQLKQHGYTDVFRVQVQ